MKPSLLLAGVGYMGKEYAKVLNAMGVPFIAVGKNDENAQVFERETGIAAVRGGLPAYLAADPPLPPAAIIATNERALASSVISLLEHGVRNLLVEKPGGLTPHDIQMAAEKARSTNARVFIGYNRRFYASTQKARDLIAHDGGVQSFHFEFTEWVHKISDAQKQSDVGAQWFLANSTHVIDLAFFLGGVPATISAFTAGGLPWHPQASIYAGAGVSNTGALFSYQANWGAPGRWSVEMITAAHRYIFRPLEKLSVQQIGSVAIEDVAIDDTLDVQYKPGLWREVESFLGDTHDLPTIAEQVEMLKIYKRINTPHV